MKCVQVQTLVDTHKVCVCVDAVSIVVYYIHCVRVQMVLQYVENMKRMPKIMHTHAKNEVLYMVYVKHAKMISV